MVGSAPASGGRWAAILATVFCVGVAAAVLLVGRGDDTPSVPTHPGGAPVPPPDPGSPTPVSVPAGCESPDPDTSSRFTLHLEGGRYDFGKVAQGVQIEREVEFENTGNHVLCVMKVGTRCGCLKARLTDPARKRFAPGERGRITLMLDTSNRAGDEEKHFYVVTNDLEAPNREYPTRFDVSIGVIAYPGTLDLGRTPPRTPATGTLFLKSETDDDDWKVVRITGSRPGPDGTPYAYTHETNQLADPKHRVLQVAITHPGLDGPQEFRDRLLVETSHPKRPRVLVHLVLRVVPRIRPVPPRLSLGLVRAGTQTKSMQVRLVPGSPEIRVGIRKVRFEAPPGRQGEGAGFQAVHGRDGDLAFVTVRYDGAPRRPRGVVRSVLVIETDDPVTPEVRVDVSATVQPD